MIRSKKEKHFVCSQYCCSPESGASAVNASAIKKYYSDKRWFSYFQDFNSLVEPSLKSLDNSWASAATQVLSRKTNRTMKNCKWLSFGRYEASGSHLSLFSCSTGESTGERSLLSGCSYLLSTLYSFLWEWFKTTSCQQVQNKSHYLCILG